ncbi:uncharacterized protein HaLaN_27288 [Haematococcus lacustris]|uniref:Uncharacterized protein n=1 Tax=Haematococcus lacustris TaxID=44745 RepID=A0A6A0A848_HAELA|nr:uncharacterized protein HaLaN_27288 [Haematococcus lacustris]
MCLPKRRVSPAASAQWRQGQANVVRQPIRSTLSAGPRDDMLALLQQCITPASSTKVMRVLATSAAAARLAPLTAMYQLTTGIPIQFDSIATLTQYATVRLRSISNPSVLNLTHEAWLVTASAMGDGLAAGAFADLSHLVSLDSRLQWTDMFTQTREAGLIYGRQVIALPLSTYSYQLHYRVDLLAKYNRTVPTTWRQLIQTASQLNGTEGKWGFCGNWGPCALLGTNLVK